jgi:DNA polymerase III alpha subunit
MVSLFKDRPEAIGETLRFASEVKFTLADLKYNYPDEPVPVGKTPQEHLIDCTWEGAAKRYPQGVPPKIKETLEKELVCWRKCHKSSTSLNGNSDRWHLRQQTALFGRKRR